MPKKYKYRTTFTVDGKRYSVYADTKKELIEKEIRKKIEIGLPVCRYLQNRSERNHSKEVHQPNESLHPGADRAYEAEGH